MRRLGFKKCGHMCVCVFDFLKEKESGRRPPAFGPSSSSFKLLINGFSKKTGLRNRSAKV